MEISLLEELARSDSYFWESIIKNQSDYDLRELAGKVSSLHDSIKDEIKRRVDEGVFDKPHYVSYLFETQTQENQ